MAVASSVIGGGGGESYSYARKFEYLQIFKDSCHIIAPILTIIFNQSLKTGIFPNDWALARVSPIFKSGVKSEIGNYRPISVLSTVSKIFEKVICNQITNYFEYNKLFTKF